MVEPGRYVGIRQAPLLRLPDLPGRPLRRHGVLAQFSAAQKRTEVIRQQSHPTAGSSPSNHSSLRGPSCCLHLHSSAAAAAALIPASSHAPCPTMESGKCHTAHLDPTSGRAAFHVRSLCFTSLSHCRYVGGSASPACSVSGGLASAHNINY